MRVEPEPVTMLVCCDFAAQVRGKGFPVRELEARLLSGIGWTPIAPEVAKQKRGGEDSMLLHDELEAALARFNPWMTADAIRQVIEKLDRRNKQVFVQAMIAEVSANKAKELGVQWGFFGGATNGTLATVATFDPFGTVATLPSTITALSTLGIDPASVVGAANFPAALQALQDNGALNVLSTPNIMTSDNKEVVVETGAFLTQAADVGNVVVGVFGGRPVYLREVAEIVDGAEEPAHYVFFGSGAAHPSPALPSSPRLRRTSRAPSSPVGEGDGVRGSPFDSAMSTLRSALFICRMAYTGLSITPATSPPSVGNTAMPELTVIAPAVTSGKACRSIAVRMRSATTRAPSRSVCGRITVNSSCSGAAR